LHLEAADPPAGDDTARTVDHVAARGQPANAELAAIVRGHHPQGAINALPVHPRDGDRHTRRGFARRISHAPGNHGAPLHGNQQRLGFTELRRRHGSRDGTVSRLAHAHGGQHVGRDVEAEATRLIRQRREYSAEAGIHFDPRASDCSTGPRVDEHTAEGNRADARRVRRRLRGRETGGEEQGERCEDADPHPVRNYLIAPDAGRLAFLRRLLRRA
jgi:hypothetical protein